MHEIIGKYIFCINVKKISSVSPKNGCWQTHVNNNGQICVVHNAPLGRPQALLRGWYYMDFKEIGLQGWGTGFMLLRIVVSSVFLWNQ